jgi:hypothetical protein
MSPLRANLRPEPVTDYNGDVPTYAFNQICLLLSFYLVKYKFSCFITAV